MSVGLLTRVFPAAVIDEVVQAAGRTEQRNRALPARVMACFSIGMGLYAEASYEDVFAQLTNGLSWSSGWSEAFAPPPKSAIFQARRRLGFEPVRDLFARVARPLAGPDTPGSWLAGRRLMSIDGTILGQTDSVVNSEGFGRPPVSRGEQSAFRQARLVAMAEYGTKAALDAVMDPCMTSEVELSRGLDGRFTPAMLVLADHGFYGFRLWAQTAATGANRLRRVRTNLRPRHLETLAAGSWTTRSARSWLRPPSTLAVTPTGSLPCRIPQRPPFRGPGRFPHTQPDHSRALWRHAILALVPRQNPGDVGDQTLASSNVRSRRGPPNASTTHNGHNPSASQKSPLKHLPER